MERQHRAHVLDHGLARGGIDGFGIGRAAGFPVRQAPALGEIAVDGIVRGRLIGDHIGLDATADEFGEHVGGIAEKSNRHGLFLAC